MNLFFTNVAPSNTAFQCHVDDITLHHIYIALDLSKTFDLSDLNFTYDDTDRQGSLHTISGTLIADFLRLDT